MMSEHHIRFDVAGFSANPGTSESFDVMLDMTQTQMEEAFLEFRDMLSFDKLVELFDQDGYLLRHQTNEEIHKSFIKEL